MSPIVVATDLSAHAAEALRYALRFRPRPIHLYHVHDVSRPEPYDITLDEAYRAANDGTTKVHVEAALRQATEGIDGLTVVWHSEIDTDEAIERYAKATEAGLVIVGTHGLTGYRRLILGSVAEAVVRRASCDVLTVPLVASAPWSARGTHRLLCGVDLSQASEDVAKGAAGLADQLGAESLRIVYVQDGSAPAVLRDIASGPPVLESAENTLARLTQAYGTVVTAVGPSAQTLMEMADDFGADLIVVGSHRRSGAARVLGSVAARVLRESRRPTLVVRTHSRT